MRAQSAKEWPDPDQLRAETHAVQVRSLVVARSFAGRESVDALPSVRSVYKQGVYDETVETRAQADGIETRAATEGDVKSSRPGMLDILGRAKWCVRAICRQSLLSASVGHPAD